MSEDIMKERVSIMVILLVTLLIGIAIGWFIPQPAPWTTPQGVANFDAPGSRGMHTPGTGMGPAQGMPMHQRVVERLNLNPEQRQQFFGVIRRHRNDMRTMMERRRTHMQPQIDSLFNAMNSDMKEILSPEQYEQWQQWSQQRMHQLGGPRRGAGGMGPGNRRGNR